MTRLLALLCPAAVPLASLPLGVATGAAGQTLDRPGAGSSFSAEVRENGPGQREPGAGAAVPGPDGVAGRPSAR